MPYHCLLWLIMLDGNTVVFLKHFLLFYLKVSVEIFVAHVAFIRAQLIRLTLGKTVSPSAHLPSQKHPKRWTIID